MKKFALAVVTAVAFAGSAHAADLVLDPGLTAPVPMAQDWTGFYAGVFGGYGSGSVSYVSGGVTNSVPIGGFLGGGAAGYNQQWDHFVLGAEGDIAWSNLTGSKALGAGVTLHSNNGWQGTLRGRAGVVFDPVPVLFFATAGLAAGGLTTSATGIAGATPYSATQIGWTAGVGVEGKVTDQLSLKLEYAYTDLGTTTIPAGALAPGSLAVTSHPTFQSVKLGANWHF